MTDRPVLSGGWNSHPNLELFLRTSDGNGGVGADHFNYLAFHAYMYNFDPQVIYSEARRYRQQLVDAESALGRPGLGARPIIDTESGHEVEGKLATDTSVEIVARNMKQVVGFGVAAAVKYGMQRIVLYADKTNPRTFRGPFNSQPIMRDAAQYCHNVDGKVARQIWIREGGGDPAVVIRFSDNTEYRA